LESGKETLTLSGHTDLVSSLALSPCGKRLFSGSADTTIKVWDLESGKETLTLSGHTDLVHRLALSPGGKRLVSGSRDKTIKVWDLNNRARFSCTRKNAGFSAASQQTYRCCIIAHGYLEAVKETLTLRGHTSEVNCLVLSPCGKRLFSGGGMAFMDGKWVHDGTIKVWDLEAGQDTGTLRGHTHAVYSLVLSPCSKRLFSGSWDNTIKVWDLETGKETLTLRGHTEGVLSLALSPCGKQLWSGSMDNTIKVWDLETGQDTLTLRGHTDFVNSLALSPGGKRLVSGAGELVIGPNKGGGGGEIKVWDLESGQEILTLRGYTAGVSSLVLSPCGKRLFSGSGGDPTIKMWDLETEMAHAVK
jgi:WD40 repeat protein